MLDLNAFVPKARFQPGVALSPDATEVAYSSNISGRYALWVAPVRGGEPRCLADLPEQAVRQIAWAPDGNTLVFAADRNGDEQYQIYRLPRSGGTPERLTKVDDRQHKLAADPFDPRGRYLIYAANDREETVQDLVIRDLHDGTERRHVPVGKASFQPNRVSPDCRWLLIEGLQLQHRLGLLPARPHSPRRGACACYRR
jgi:Tol biopolymer transport system component